MHDRTTVLVDAPFLGVCGAVHIQELMNALGQEDPLGLQEQLLINHLRLYHLPRFVRSAQLQEACLVTGRNRDCSGKSGWRRACGDCCVTWASVRVGWCIVGAVCGSEEGEQCGVVGVGVVESECAIRWRAWGLVGCLWGVSRACAGEGWCWGWAGGGGWVSECAAVGSPGDGDAREPLAAVAAMDEVKAGKGKYEEKCVMARAFALLRGWGALHKAAAKIEGAGTRKEVEKVWKELQIYAPFIWDRGRAVDPAIADSVVKAEDCWGKAFTREWVKRTCSQFEVVVDPEMHLQVLKTE